MELLEDSQLSEHKELLQHIKQLLEQGNNEQLMKESDRLVKDN